MAEYIGNNIYIRPTYLVSLPEYSGGFGGRSAKQVDAEKNLKDKSHKGNLSHKSSRKLLNAVNWLVVSAKKKYLWSEKYKKAFQFKINFITLTIPYDNTHAVSERQLKRCLHSWLSYSRKYFYLRNYVWKFEKTVAGQLHIHLTTDTFISWRRVRKAWNSILEREGLLENHFKRFGDRNPNSTDIHAVHKVKDIGAYIAKYMSKSSETMGEFKGRIWSCNREISEVNSCSVFISRHDGEKEMRKLLLPEVEYKPIMSPPDAFGQNKQIGEIFFMNEKVWQTLQKSMIKETYDTHRFHIRNNIEQMPPEYWQGFVDEFFSKNPNLKNNEKIIPPGKPPNSAVHSDVQRGKLSKNAYSQTTFEEMLH